jgi:hypothetical protein
MYVTVFQLNLGNFAKQFHDINFVKLLSCDFDCPSYYRLEESVYTTIFISTNNSNYMFRREPSSGSGFALLKVQLINIVISVHLSYN